MQVWEFVQNLASVHMEEEPAVLQSSSSCLGDNDTSALQGSDGPDVSMLAVPSVPAAEAVENVPMDAHRGACPVALAPGSPQGSFHNPRAWVPPSVRLTVPVGSGFDPLTLAGCGTASVEGVRSWSCLRPLQRRATSRSGRSPSPPVCPHASNSPIPPASRTAARSLPPLPLVLD